MSPTSREAATEARREQITHAAISVLAQRGYQATTFDAICVEAGLSSKRLITYHFSTREELLEAVADRVAADAEAYIVPALEGANGARELLAAVIRANVAFMATHLEQMRALQQIILNGAQAWERHHTESVNRLAGLFAEGQRVGVFRPCNARLLAAVLRASIDSMYEPLSRGVDPDVCANELVVTFDRATYAGPLDRG